MFTKLKTDNAGNLYLSSEYSTSNAPFVGKDTLRNSDATKYLLLAKLNSDLEPVWSIHYKNIGNSSIGTLNMFTDGQDNIYLILKGNNILEIDGVAYSTIGTNGVLKVKSSGEVVYFKVLPFALSNMVGAGDNNGNAYISGILAGSAKSITLDGITATNTNPLFFSSNFDPFIIKMNDAGTANWIKLSNNALSGSSNTLGANGVSLDSKGNLYVYGDFNNKIVFDTDTLTGNAPDQYAANPYIVKYNNAGVQKWAHTVTKLSKTGPQFLQMRISKKDLLYIYTTQFSGGTINTLQIPKMTSSGSSDRLLFCFDTNMVSKWYRYLSGGETNNQKANIGVSDNEDVYVASGSKGLKLGRLESNGSFTQTGSLAAASGFSGFSYVAKYAADTSAIVTGVSTIEKQGFKIYPNPASRVLNFENRSGAIVSLEFYSITGALVKQVNANTTSGINIEDLSKGLYFVKMSSQNFSEVQKLIIE